MTLQAIRSSTTKVHFKVMQLNPRVSEDVNYIETQHVWSWKHFSPVCFSVESYVEEMSHLCIFYPVVLHYIVPVHLLYLSISGQLTSVLIIQ